MWAKLAGDTDTNSSVRHTNSFAYFSSAWGHQPGPLQGPLPLASLLPWMLHDHILTLGGKARWEGEGKEREYEKERERGR